LSCLKLISYEIVFKNTSSNNRKHGKSNIESYGTDVHKREIFERVKRNNKLHEGDIAQIKGTPKRGIIIKICQHFDEVQWQSLLPLMIHLKMGDEVVAAYPSQLKRRTKL
jgi:hypothetical protein